MKYMKDSYAFPYKIPKRLILLSQPRKGYWEGEDNYPALTERGTRKSALRGRLTDKNSDIAWPYLSPERLERIDRMIEASNATMYSKLANCSIDLKKQDIRDSLKKRKGWTDTEWKKHMDYISQIAGPKKEFPPPAIKRGKSKPLDALMPRIRQITSKPDFKCYRRLSQEEWYRDPVKVPSSALKYKISDRVKKLAVARVIPVPEEH